MSSSNHQFSGAIMWVSGEGKGFDEFPVFVPQRRWLDSPPWPCLHTRRSLMLHGQPHISWLRRKKTAAVEGTPVFKERNPGFCCAGWQGPQKKQDIAKCSPFMSILYETQYARIIWWGGCGVPSSHCCKLFPNITGRFIRVGDAYLYAVYLYNIYIYMPSWLLHH